VRSCLINACPSARPVQRQYGYACLSSLLYLASIRQAQASLWAPPPCPPTHQRRGELARDSDLLQYGNSKLYCVMAAREMARRLAVSPAACRCQLGAEIPGCQVGSRRQAGSPNMGKMAGPRAAAGPRCSLATAPGLQLFVPVWSAGQRSGCVCSAPRPGGHAPVQPYLLG
jgi:hypothetical protein